MKEKEGEGKVRKFEEKGTTEEREQWNLKEGPLLLLWNGNTLCESTNHFMLTGQRLFGSFPDEVR